jgi:hypothetical protein
MKLRFIVILCSVYLGIIGHSSAQIPPVPTSAPGTLAREDSYIRSDRLGITFISSIDSYNNPDRYRNALILGAGWNRWPLYWDRVETAPNTWDWSAYDNLVEADLRNQLSINAILLGRPEFRADGTTIQAIFEPIFADGKDTPTTGVSINPNNPWAQFVYEAVSRYKPDGILARQRNLRSGQGISVWEIWNEPDLAQFWQGSVNDYARMLKTAYIVIKTVDPSATVLFGALLYATTDTWLTQVLSIFKDDALSASYNWFMDAVAIHSYDDPWRSAWLALYVRQGLKAYGLERPIWLNESGVSVWNDYPGPVWATNSESRIRLATTEQQAYYTIMSTAYAWSEGVDKVFFHQLYDDCGNQPAGTNFPPHNGELCSSGTCFGDAFGIYRNPADAICYSQHPFANTPRPIATAYRLMAEVFGREDFTNGNVENIDGKITVISFDRPRTEERILVIWNRTFEQITFPLTPISQSATLYTMEGTQPIVPADDGYYYFNLDPASDFSFPDVDAKRITAIGGEPIIVIESTGESTTPIGDFVIASTDHNETALRITIEPTVGALIVESIRATVAPQDDTTPPTPTMQALPPTSDRIFRVKWGAQDNGEVKSYFVWVRVNNGDWIPWLDTTATQGDYAGESGSLYEFAVWAQDVAENWSLNTELQPMASTRVE